MLKWNCKVVLVNGYWDVRNAEGTHWWTSKAWSTDDLRSGWAKSQTQALENFNSTCKTPPPGWIEVPIGTQWVHSARKDQVCTLQQDQMVRSTQGTTWSLQQALDFEVQGLWIRVVRSFETIKLSSGDTQLIRYAKGHFPAPSSPKSQLDEVRTLVAYRAAINTVNNDSIIRVLTNLVETTLGRPQDVCRILKEAYQAHMPSRNRPYLYEERLVASFIAYLCGLQVKSDAEVLIELAPLDPQAIHGIK